jgi:DNA-binding response OmpR family regulator
MANEATRTILVVEDEQDILFLVKMLLEAEGYTVRTATNGHEGLAAIECSMPDLVLLDMMMPVMNGWDFAAEFRSRFADAAPIVVMTAAESARQRAAEIGASGWLGKPFEIDDLCQIVNSHLR